jgi:hypothetical protein
MEGGQAVSDTPRTDSARHDEHDPYIAIASECSKLERELNEANAKIKRLEREVELFREHADYGDISLVEAILKGEEIGRKEKEAKP